MLRDRITFVTGASAGIGAASAEAFAREGSHLLLAARRADRLEDLAARLTADHGIRCHTIGLDVRDRSQVEATLDALPEPWRVIDILVNNAGLSRGLETVQGGNVADWEEMIDTNIKGLLWVTKSVLPGMVQRDHGHVINIGSISGRQVYAGGAVYCATKFAVRAINQGLRLDLVGTKVRCSAVDPGMVQTEFSEVRFHGDTARADQVYRAFPPLQAADVAETVLFCATRPEHVNIQEILVMPQDQAAVYASHPRGLG